MNRLFVDTSGWIALVNKSERLHALAARIYQGRFAAGWKIATHSGVMLEVGNGLSAIALRDRAAQLQQRLSASPNIEIVFVDHELYAAGWELYGSRRDKTWGVVDQAGEG